MLGEGFAWIGGSYKPVKLDQCDGYSDNFDYLTIRLFAQSYYLCIDVVKTLKTVSNLVVDTISVRSKEIHASKQII